MPSIPPKPPLREARPAAVTFSSTSGPLQYIHMPAGPQIDLLMRSREIDQRYFAVRNITIGLANGRIRAAELPSEDLVQAFLRNELALGTDISPQHRTGVSLGNDFVSETDRSRIPAAAESIKANLIGCLAAAQIKDERVLRNALELAVTTNHHNLIANCCNYFSFFRNNMAYLSKMIGTIDGVLSKPDLRLPEDLAAELSQVKSILIRYLPRP